MNNTAPASTEKSAETAEEQGDRRLDSRTLWEQVRDRLREEILSGELAPGAVLSEVSLARSGSAAARFARRSGGLPVRGS
jgi:hypothetical protein